MNCIYNIRTIPGLIPFFNSVNLLNINILSVRNRTFFENRNSVNTCLMLTNSDFTGAKSYH